MQILTSNHDWSDEVFLCDCGSLDHCVKFLYFKPESAEDDDEIYLEVFNTNWRNLWQRLVVGFKHVFGKNIEFGIFQGMTFRFKDMTRLLNFLSLQRPNPEHISKIDPDKLITTGYMMVDGDYYTLKIEYELIHIKDESGNPDGWCMPELGTSVHFLKSSNVFSKIKTSLMYVLKMSKRFNSTDCYTLKPTDTDMLKMLAKSYHNYIVTNSKNSLSPEEKK